MSQTVEIIETYKWTVLGELKIVKELGLYKANKYNIRLAWGNNLLVVEVDGMYSLWDPYTKELKSVFWNEPRCKMPTNIPYRFNPGCRYTVRRRLEHEVEPVDRIAKFHHMAWSHDKKMFATMVSYQEEESVINTVHLFYLNENTLDNHTVIRKHSAPMTLTFCWERINPNGLLIGTPDGIVRYSISSGIDEMLITSYGPKHYLHTHESGSIFISKYRRDHPLLFHTFFYTKDGKEIGSMNPVGCMFMVSHSGDGKAVAASGIGACDLPTSIAFNNRVSRVAPNGWGEMHIISSNGNTVAILPYDPAKPFRHYILE